MAIVIWNLNGGREFIAKMGFYAHLKRVQP